MRLGVKHEKLPGRQVFEAVYHSKKVIYVEFLCPACYIPLEVLGAYGHEYEVVRFQALQQCPHCKTEYQDGIQPYDRTAHEWIKLSVATRDDEVRECLREEMTKKCHAPSNMRGKSGNSVKKRKPAPTLFKAYAISEAS